MSLYAKFVMKYDHKTRKNLQLYKKNGIKIIDGLLNFQFLNFPGAKKGKNQQLWQETFVHQE